MNEKGEKSVADIDRAAGDGAERKEKGSEPASRSSKRKKRRRGGAGGDSGMISRSVFLGKKKKEEGGDPLHFFFPGKGGGGGRGLARRRLFTFLPGSKTYFFLSFPRSGQLVQGDWQRRHLFPCRIPRRSAPRGRERGQGRACTERFGNSLRAACRKRGKGEKVEGGLWRGRRQGGLCGQEEKEKKGGGGRESEARLANWCSSCLPFYPNRAWPMRGGGKEGRRAGRRRAGRGRFRIVCLPFFFQGKGAKKREEGERSEYRPPWCCALHSLYLPHRSEKGVIAASRAANGAQQPKGRKKKGAGETFSHLLFWKE